MGQHNLMYTHTFGNVLALQQSLCNHVLALERTHCTKALNNVDAHSAFSVCRRYNKLSAEAGPDAGGQ